MRAGIPLAGASDAPVVPPSPWVGIAAARARRTAAGATLGAAERLGARAALRLFTTGGGIRARRRPARDARARRTGRPGRRRARSAARAARRGGRCADAPDGRCRRARVAGVRAVATLRYEKRGAVAIATLGRPEALAAHDV